MPLGFNTWDDDSPSEFESLWDPIGFTFGGFIPTRSTKHKETRNMATQFGVTIYADTYEELATIVEAINSAGVDGGGTTTKIYTEKELDAISDFKALKALAKELGVSDDDLSGKKSSGVRKAILAFQAAQAEEEADEEDEEEDDDSDDADDEWDDEDDDWEEDDDSDDDDDEDEEDEDSDDDEDEDDEEEEPEPPKKKGKKAASKKSTKKESTKKSSKKTTTKKTTKKAASKKSAGKKGGKKGKK